jgi:hypothetical protein
MEEGLQKYFKRTQVRHTPSGDTNNQMDGCGAEGSVAVAGEKRMEEMR